MLQITLSSCGHPSNLSLIICVILSGNFPSIGKPSTSKAVKEGLYPRFYDIRSNPNQNEVTKLSSSNAS